MKVIVPDVLHSYTGAREIEVSGNTLIELLDQLEDRYPGIRFRIVNELNAIRPNIKFFINRVETRDLDTSLVESDEVFIMQALSGG